MADRPKKKSTSGERNPNRSNGKAPKQHPKQPGKHAGNAKKTWLQREEERRARRAPLHAEYLKRIEEQKAEAAKQAEKDKAKRARKSRMSAAQARRQQAQNATAKIAKSLEKSA